MAVTGTNITLTTRTAKGSALTHAELDANQTGLKDAVEGHSHDEFASALGADDNYMTDAEKTKLAGIATGAEVNVQADWNASTGAAVILNKPSIPSISGLLNEAAHDALDHTGLPGVPAAYTLPTASTSVLGGVKVDGTTVLISDGVISSTVGSGGGVTDHGLLTGLSDDDHSQYYNQTRGDARYSQTNHNHNLNDLTEKSYNSLTDKPSIPSITGLLNEAAHDLLDHTGLTGIPAAYSLPTASTTVLGGVKVDGTTVTISNGVISSSSGSGITNPMTAAGDIIIGGVAGAPTRLAKGTDGQLLGYIGGTLAPVNAPSGGVGTLVAEVTVSTATTTISFTGLDCNTAGGYILLCEAKNATSSLADLNLFFNGDTAGGNYVNREIYASGGSVGTGTGDACITQLPAGVGLDGSSETSITVLASGKGRAMTRFSLDGNSQEALITKTTTAAITNITRIDIISSVSGAIAVGSKFTLLKRK